VDPGRIKGLQDFSEQSILEELKKRRRFIDGVVISGGEPTLQPDLPEFLEKCQKLDLETMIETNGTKPGVIAILLSRYLVNFLALDFKGPLDNRYAKIVGLKNFSSKIWIKSLKIILHSGIPFELRTTVVPGVHDEKVLLEMARQLKKILRNEDIKKLKANWYFQNFQPKNCLDPKFEKIKPFSKIELEEILKAAEKVIPEVKIRS
jgi:pyruvate formate lyase activating enzyme